MMYQGVNVDGLEAYIATVKATERTKKYTDRGMVVSGTMCCVAE